MKNNLSKEEETEKVAEKRLVNLSKEGSTVLVVKEEQTEKVAENTSLGIRISKSQDRKNRNGRTNFGLQLLACNDTLSISASKRSRLLEKEGSIILVVKEEDTEKVEEIMSTNISKDGSTVLLVKFWRNFPLFHK